MLPSLRRCVCCPHRLAHSRSLFAARTGKEGDSKEALDYITQQFLSKVTSKRTGPAVLTWPISARSVICAVPRAFGAAICNRSRACRRFRKDVQFAFMELKEKLVQQHKQHIAKAVDAVKKDEERRSKDKPGKAS